MEQGLERDAPAAVQQMSYQQLIQARNAANAASSESSQQSVKTEEEPPAGGTGNNSQVDQNQDASTQSDADGGPDSTASNSFDVSVFKDVIGQDFKDIDEVKSYVSELKKMQESLIKPDDLPDSVKTHWELVKQGKADKDFYKELATDYESMDDFDVILQSELRSEKNKDRDRELVTRSLKRDLRNDLKIIDQASQIEKLSPEELEDYMLDNELSKEDLESIKDDADFARLSLKEKAESARKQLVEGQAKLLQSKEPSNELPPEVQEKWNNHLKRIETAAKDFETVEFDLGKEGVEPYKLSLNGKTPEETSQIQSDFLEYMKDPLVYTQKALNETFLDGEQGIDYEGFSKFYHVLKNWDKLPELIAEHVTQQGNISAIERKQVNPQGQQSNPGSPTQKTRHEAMLEAARMAKEQGLI